MLKRTGLLATTLFLCAALITPALASRPFTGRTVQLKTQLIAPGSGVIKINFSAPPGSELEPDAPSTYWIRVQNPAVLKVSPPQSKPFPLDLSKLPFPVPVEASLGQTVLAADLRAHFCDKVTQICLTDRVRVKFRVRVETNAPHEISLTLPLESKKQS